MENAPKRLAIVFCAAKAMATPTTPAPVSNGVISTWKRFWRMNKMAMNQTTVLTMRRIKSSINLLVA